MSYYTIIKKDFDNGISFKRPPEGEYLARIYSFIDQGILLCPSFVNRKPDPSELKPVHKCLITYELTGCDKVVFKEGDPPRHYRLSDSLTFSFYNTGKLAELISACGLNSELPEFDLSSILNKEVIIKVSRRGDYTNVSDVSAKPSLVEKISEACDEEPFLFIMSNRVPIEILERDFYRMHPSRREKCKENSFWLKSRMPDFPILRHDEITVKESNVKPRYSFTNTPENIYKDYESERKIPSVEIGESWKNSKIKGQLLSQMSIEELSAKKEIVISSDKTESIIYFHLCEALDYFLNNTKDAWDEDNIPF